MKLDIKSAFVAAALVLPAGAQAQDFLSIGSCPVTCTAYTWSAGIADVINRNVDGVQATAEETKGYVANIALMQNGELEASMATSLSAYEAWAATGNYAGTEPGKILSWMSIAPVAMHIIALEGGPVNSVEDLKGKRIGMGQPGGVSMLDANVLMAKVAGEDFEPFRVRLGDMVDMLSDGNIDAALWNGSFPLAPVIKLAATRDLKLIPVEDGFFDALRADYPPYFRLSIPGGTYEDVADDIPTYGLANGLVISADVPEERVYQMTKAVFENLDALAGVHPAFGKMSKETILNGFGSPLHPGALRYYREIGVPGIEDFVARTGG
ncbi:TAXI family TRAP transporter solute-binding subunit [Alphaproteobacteria bacterium GH1-50]|uniref:TAXI family TRAP transporter solute-binding subunit n=1 Tax=Kangsaoukella pontilimi TaxID=2691042 RepID=A0A7C9INJ4_9RHOB|nr:TAXI family TRAP transporter solute-binding subunit [Kangsaoukella pontilimi]MXQ07410.1 TAXI family TRAP transporter solute-binding subunit [Kangsaoukella pontilimi]